jgi:hypothetical protein
MGAARATLWRGGRWLIDGGDSMRSPAKPSTRFNLLTATPEPEMGDWEGGHHRWWTRYRRERWHRWRKLAWKWGGTPMLGPSATMEEASSHRRMADGGVVIWGGGQRSGTRAAKTRANGAWGQGETLCTRNRRMVARVGGLPVRQWRHAGGKSVQRGHSSVNWSPASVRSARCTVGLNRLGPLFYWAGPNPLLESFSF